MLVLPFEHCGAGNLSLRNEELSMRNNPGTQDLTKTMLSTHITLTSCHTVATTGNIQGI